MSVYARAIETARRVIRQKGAACVWASAVGTADADEPWKETPDDDAETDVSIVFLPANRETRELFRMLQGTEVVAGMSAGIMASKEGFTPQVGDMIRRNNGDLLRAYSIDPLALNDEVILYTLQMAK